MTARIGKLAKENRPELLIICLTILVYINSLFNGFVWLDYSYIINNSLAHSFNISKLLIGSGLVGLPYYRPLVSIYFSLLYTFFNDNAFFYHAIQLVIFTANGLLAYKIFAYFIKKQYALAMVLLFLLTPINQINAAFISASADTFFMFFGLFALFIYINDEKAKRLKTTFLLLLAALLCKETAVLFAFAILFFELFIRRKNIHIYVKFSILVILSYVFIRILSQGLNFDGISLDQMERLSLMQRSLNIPIIILKYFQAFFLLGQIGIAQEWTIKTIQFSNFYAPLLFDVAIFSFCTHWVLSI